MKTRLLVCIVALLALIAASCGVSREFSKYEGIENAATLTFPDGSVVNVPISDVERIAGQIEDNTEASALVFQTGVPETFDLDVLSTLVQVEILDKGLADRGVTVSDDDVAVALDSLDQDIARLVETNEDPEADRVLIQDGISEYLELIAIQTTRQQNFTAQFLVEAEVPCSRHILLETEGDALDALSRLDDGEDFAELAMELSTGPSGPDGGDLGCSDPSGFVEPFRDAVIAATVGEVVGPVETEFGFHLILVTGTDTAAPDTAVAEQQAFEAFAGLRDTTQIAVPPALGSWDPVNGRVIPPAE